MDPTSLACLTSPKHMTRRWHVPTWAGRFQTPAPGGATAANCGWDPVRKRVVVRSRNFIGAYYPAENRWENWNIRNAPYGSDYESSVAGVAALPILDSHGNTVHLDSCYSPLRTMLKIPQCNGDVRPCRIP